MTAPVGMATGSGLEFHVEGWDQPPLRANMEHNHVLHERVVIMLFVTLPVPYVRDRDRVVLDDLGYSDDGITHMIAMPSYSSPRR